MDIAIRADDVIGRLQQRWLANVADAVEEWSAFVSTLNQWEDDHLLEHPSPGVVADHRKIVDRLLAFGSFVALLTENPRFPDRRIAEMVAATQAVLRDKLRMWHSPRMDPARADRILAACFPNEP